MSKEAMTLALEALEGSIAITMAKIDLRNTAIKALEEALASEQELKEPDYKTLAIQLQQERKQEQGEIERLTAALKKANEQAEHFERKWYLLGDELEKLKQEQRSDSEQLGEPVGWPCLIAEADFSQDTVTLAMQCTDYKVSAGKHWLYTTPQPAQKPLTDEQITSIAYDCNALPEVITDKTLIDFVRALEVIYGIKENT